MKKSLTHVLPSLLFWSLSLTSFAQDIHIDRIEESRSTSSNFFLNRCTLYLTIRNLGENSTQYIKLNKIDRAVDSEGNSLINPEEKKTTYESTQSFNLKLELLPPARRAETINELTGSFSFVSPSEKNGSLIHVPKFTSLSDKNLIPSSSSLKLTYLSPEALKKKTEEINKLRQEELDKLDAPSREFAEGILGIFGGSNSWNDNFHNVHFMMDGETSKLIDVEFIDEKGSKISNSGKSISDKQLTYYFETAPTQDWALRILVETPKSIKTIPFSFKNIRLP